MGAHHLCRLFIKQAVLQPMLRLKGPSCPGSQLCTCPEWRSQNCTLAWQLQPGQVQDAGGPASHQLGWQLRIACEREAVLCLLPMRAGSA